MVFHFLNFSTLSQFFIVKLFDKSLFLRWIQSNLILLFFMDLLACFNASMTSQLNILKLFFCPLCRVRLFLKKSSLRPRLHDWVNLLFWKINDIIKWTIFLLCYFTSILSGSYDGNAYMWDFNGNLYCCLKFRNC